MVTVKRCSSLAPLQRFSSYCSHNASRSQQSRTSAPISNKLVVNTWREKLCENGDSKTELCFSGRLPAIENAQNKQEKENASVAIRAMRGLKLFVAPAPHPQEIEKSCRSRPRRLLNRARPTPQYFRPKPAPATVCLKTTKNSCNAFHLKWQFIQWFISKQTKGS